MSEHIATDPLLQLAEQFVCRTNTNIFLTGRAGTGKTTFLRRLHQITHKRFVVLAPTGVAAINAGGQTLHSFFQLPFGPAVPGSVLKKRGNGQRETFALQLRKNKIELIRSLDLVVIDEISMVRADLLDAVDEVLRHYRRNNKPFGGLQMLMIGDLLQLPPIIKNEEWDLLREHYENLYFYSSKALAKSSFVTITLETIFRQTDDRFIALLNAVRSGKPSGESLHELNQRFRHDTKSYEDQGYITLTTHNRLADEINQSRLEAIKAPLFSLKALIKGDFPEQNYPTHEILKLKVGAQVMFVKNDPNPEKRYYNGLIGSIVDLDTENETVEVACEGYDEPITAGPIEWHNTVFELDPESKDITEKVVGTFAQVPLRLAWAVTIHKSQGLTFDKVIIDAAAAFAHGQVYVALSRCRSLEGLIFKSKIPQHAIKSHESITIWLDDQKEALPDEEQLSNHSRQFVKQLLTELFEFETLRAKTDYLLRIARRNATSLSSGFADKLLEANTIVDNQLENIGKNFLPQLFGLIENMESTEGKQALSARLKQASVYFSGHLDNIQKLLPVKAETDDKVLRKSVGELLSEIQGLIAAKQKCLKQVMEEFNLDAFLKVRALASIGEPESDESTAIDHRTDADNAGLQLLKQKLLQWRKEEARQQGIEPSRVIPLSTIFQISDDPPLTLRQLEKVKGIGKKRIALYGQTLIGIIDNCLERPTQTPEKPSKRKSGHELSLEIYNNNPSCSLQTIAGIRGIAVSTLETHLSHAVEQGLLSIDGLVDPRRILLIEEYFESVDDDKLGPAREVLGEEVSWAELKFVRAAMRHRGYWKNLTSGQPDINPE